MTSANPTRAGHRRRQMIAWANTVLFTASMIAIAGSLTLLLNRPALRVQLDATKTRAYSLSGQTRSLLGRLSGDWRISILLVKGNVDRATLRQIDEVLRRYDEASEAISVERIDPTDPGTIDRYEALIDRLRGIYAGEIQEYSSRLNEASEAYERAIAFAAREQGNLDRLMTGLAADDPMRGLLQTVRNNFAVFARNGPQVSDYVAESLATSESKPIPTYEAARDALAAGLGAAAADIAATASLYEQWMTRSGASAAVGAYLARARVGHEAFAADLQGATDPLLQLAPLRLTQIGEELARGEAALITGPDNAAVIPAHQLLPRSNVRTTREGWITFDQRFRGEQLLSSTIQSMIVDSMPMVVFVHGQSESILRSGQSRVDLVGVGSVLRSMRYDVREWPITNLDRPQPRAGQRTVWIVVTPPPGGDRRSFEPSREEIMLLGRMRQLIAEGEPVLLSFYPSVMHKLNQPDPWQGHLAGFGIRVDTARVLLGSQVAPGGGRTQVQWADFTDIRSDHPVGQAVSGQLVRLPVPVPIEIASELPTGVRRWILIEQPADASRWLEDDWLDAIRNGETDVPPEKRLDQPAPLAAAASRPHPLDQNRRQRLVVVGSGTWMQSSIADQVVSLGGARVALVFPGNYELLQASVAWLAGMDDMIARSPTSQQVARLDGVTPSVRTLWWWIALVILPGGCLVIGAVVWTVRRV